MATVAVLTGATISGNPVAEQRPDDMASQFATVNGRQARSGEVLVRFRRQLGSFERGQLEQQTDADENRVVGGMGVRRIHSRRYDTQTLLAFLRNHPDVEYAEPNYIVEADAVPNDPSFTQLWGLRNTGQVVGVAGTPGADIEATLAWDISTGSANTVVAVIDTGVNYNHPDLAANMWSAPTAFNVTIGGQTITCPAGSRGFNAIANTCDPLDDNGHGTHIAGTIGAVGNNGVGVVGVNWTTRMMAVKTLGFTGTGTVADAIDGIEFVIQAAAATGANVRVLNNSWSTGYSLALLDEINKAHANNMLFVASAGNSTSNNDVVPNYPASYTAPNVIAVAATKNNDALAGNSNYGATSVHLAAPGVNVLSTYTSPAYQYLSGTSMAAPHVSGAAALVLSSCTLNTVDLRTNILANVDPIPLLTGRVSTGGRLNVNTAIRVCMPSFSLDATPGTRAITPGTSTSYTATVTPSGGFSGTVTFSVSGLPSGTTASFSPPSLTTLPGSSTLTVTSTPATPVGSALLTITATSGALVRTDDVTLVTEPNDPPVATDDSTTTVEDTPIAIAVVGNDTDPNEDALTVTEVGPPAHGTAAINPDNTVTYTPAGNYTGPDTFTYTVADGGGGTDRATVTLDVTPANDPPVAANDSYTTDEDTALVVALPGVLGNDSDVDTGTLTAVVVATPVHGTLSLNANGSFTYTPTANYSGSDSFTYKANDGSAASSIATAAITVTSVNDAPASVNDTYTVNEDTPLVVALPGVLGNDSDIDSDTTTAVVVANPANGALTLNADGSFTYTPNANYNGSDSFTYRANDGSLDSNTATVAITITAVNDAPVATPQAGLTTNEDTSKAITLSGTDVEGSALTYTVLTQPAHGTLSGTAPSLTFTPTANYSGPDSFTFKVNDGTADSGPATVSITVSAVNEAPVADAQTVVTNENAAKTITLTATDVEGSALTFPIVTLPAHGALSGTLPALTYTPAANYSGPDSFTFKASDGSLDSNIAAVSIIVMATSDFSLLALPSTQTVTAGKTASYTVTAGLSGGFVGAVTFSVSGLPSGATAAFNPPFVTTSGSSTMTVTSSTTTPPGDFPLTINGTSGSGVHAVTVTMVVQATPLAVDKVVSADGIGTRTTQPFSTSAAPETLIAFVASDGPASGGQKLTVTGAGVAWSLVRRVNTQAGTSEIWKAQASVVLSNVTVRSTPAIGGFSQSLTVVTFAGAAGTGASAGASAPTGVPTVSLTTTRPGSLLYAVGNDWDEAIARALDADQTIVHEWVDSTAGDTFWVQAGTAPVLAAGTRVELGVAAPNTDRWNFVAVEILSGAVAATVPDVLNQTEADAAAAILAAGLIVGPVTEVASTTLPAHIVISENPPAGTQVLAGTPVALVVSSGPPGAVPSVVTLSEAAATTVLMTAGFTVGAITTESSMTVPAGSIISQNPAGGTQAVTGSAVAFAVSSGLPLTAVPDVATLAPAAAIAAINAAGLTVGDISTATSPTVPAGSIVNQSPATGTQVTTGSAVTLVISLGPLLLPCPAS